MFKQKAALFIYYFVFVTISFFNAPFLFQKGISTEQVGYGFSVAVLIAITLMLVSGYLNDQKIITNQRMIQLLLIITGIFYLGIYFFENATYVTISYVLLTASFLTLPSIIDSLVIHSLADNSYAKIRSYGSMGAAVSYFLAAFLMTSVDFSVVLTINVSLIVILLIIVSQINYVYIAEKNDYIKGLKAIKQNRQIWLILVIAFLTYGVIRADDPYTITYNVEIVKLTGTWIGIVGFMSIFFEAYIMNIYDKLIIRFGERKMLITVISILVVIFLTKYTMYESKIIISIGNILFGLFIGVFVPLSINLLNRNTNEHVKTTIFSMLQFVIYFGGFVLGTITTFIYVQTNFLPNIYLLHTVVIGLGLLFTIFMRKDQDA
ncbi:MAG: MFS transporter [Mycoplasmatales bacterium]